MPARTKDYSLIWHGNAELLFFSPMFSQYVANQRSNGELEAAKSISSAEAIQFNSVDIFSQKSGLVPCRNDR